MKNYSLRAKKGFTLAEVLITLGIIGVVSALTIPTLIANYQEKVTENKVKKMYNTLSNAVSMAMVENGQVDEWDVNYSSYDSAGDFFKLIEPYLKVSKNCERTPGCVYNGVYKYLSGNKHSTNYNTNTNYYKFILNDGSNLWFRVNPDVYDAGISDVMAIFWYDVNGENEPNQIGKDTFLFHAKPYGLVPHAQDSCQLDSFGWGCSSYIIKNGNMDYPKS